MTFENFFFCEKCSKFEYTDDCVVIDIIETKYGRKYMFKCPSCGEYTSSEIISDYKGDDSCHFRFVYK